MMMLGMVLLSLAQPVDDAASETPINIVIVLADDLGYGDPGCYNDQSKIPTPNIDRLAAEGLRFTDAHTPSSVCSPTRYGLLTGRYAWRTKLKRSVLWPWSLPLIEKDRLTLPAMLQQHGYHTACIGKWHLGWDWPIDTDGHVSDEFDGVAIAAKKRVPLGKRIAFSRPIASGPTSRGFHYYFGDDVPNFPPYCFIENDHTVGIPGVDKPKGMFGHDGPTLAGWDLSVVMPTLAQKAAAYIEERAKHPDQPFFLYVPLTAPHTPIAPSPHFAGKSEAGIYGDFVHEVDWVLGQVLSALDRTGTAKNTLVIFTSDNGSPQRNGIDMSGPIGSVKKFGHDPSRPWRGMKSDAWEAGHRVPYVMRWPGRTPAGETSSEPIILTDLMRTFATIVGHSLPEDSAEDSFDILTAFEGKRTHRPIHNHLVHHSGNGVFAIRQGNWKLILGKGSGGFTRYKAPADAPAGQLYHLGDDPDEMRNLYSEKPEIVEQLSELLKKVRNNNSSYQLFSASRSQ
ncbi:MAG: hypothetical protein CMJ95_00555 [Planctomycetes bacterium]|nr:hypothetical protein [Planctomycetota bacterium]